MPKIVDHDVRRREITDAVCRITLRDGLDAATFRAVAAEAGMSVPLVQHYFASKREMLDTTQIHVGERSTRRLLEWIGRTDGSARAVVAAFMKSFIPADDESRTAALMYLALYGEFVTSTASEPDEGPNPPQARAMADLMVETIADQLERGPLREGVTIHAEAQLLTALTTGLGQYVMLGTVTVDAAYAIVDAQVDRTFTP